MIRSSRLWRSTSADPSGSRRGGPRRRDLQQVADAAGRGHALHAGVEVGGHRAQRQERLRGQQQHQQRRLVGDMPGRAGAGPLRPRPGRSPARPRARAPGRTGRPPAAPTWSAVRYASVTLPDHLGLQAGAAEHLERGQALPPRQGSGRRAGPAGATGAGPGSARAGPTSTVNTGMSGSVTAMTRAEIQSASAHPHHHRERHQAGEHELGQVAGEVGVKGVQAPGGQGGDLAGPLAAEGRRAPGGAPGPRDGGAAGS